MENKNAISRFMGVCIVANALVYKTFTPAASGYFKIAGTGGWLSAIFVGLIALLLICALITIYEKCRFPSWMKKTAYVISAIYLLISAAWAVWQFAALARKISFPSSPLWFLCMFFAAAALVGACCKMNAIGTIHAITVPAVIVLAAVLTLSSLRYSEPLNLFPIFGTGTTSVFGYGLTQLTMYSDIIILFMLARYLPNGQSMLKIGFPAVLAAVVINIAVPLTFQMLTPAPASDIANIPIYALSESVSYGRFFRRPDAVFMVGWVASGILYVTTALYFSVRLVKKR